MVMGIINGVFTEVVGVTSFITTLGMLLALGGLTLIISHAQPVAMPGAEVTTHTVNVTHVVNGAKIVLPEKVNETGTFAKIFGAGTYSELIWALVIVIGVQILLRLTRWGMYTIAVGGNKHGAAEAGINVRSTVIRNFILCSIFAGFVGVLEAVRATSVTPDTAGASETMFRARLGRGHRRHAAGRRRGHRGRRADRRAVPRRPARRPDPQGRQRRLPGLHPRRRDPHRHGHQHVRRPGAEGGGVG